MRDVSHKKFVGCAVQIDLSLVKYTYTFKKVLQMQFFLNILEVIE